MARGQMVQGYGEQDYHNPDQIRNRFIEASGSYPEGARYPADASACRTYGLSATARDGRQGSTSRYRYRSLIRFRNRAFFIPWLPSEDGRPFEIHYGSQQSEAC